MDVTGQALFGLKGRRKLWRLPPPFVVREEVILGRASADCRVNPNVGTALACRLRERQPSASGKPLPPGAAEIELENVSADIIVIEVDIHPLQYLDVIVTNAEGTEISAQPYGNLFSPAAESYLLRLLPGEKYTAPISLLATVPRPKQQPGAYTVHAVYECDGLRAVSNALSLRI